MDGWRMGTIRIAVVSWLCLATTNSMVNIPDKDFAETICWDHFLIPGGVKCETEHSVWKSQKKSHFILRAKRAMFTFQVDKSSLKMPKMVNFGDILKY